MLLQYRYVPGDATQDARVALKYSWSGDVLYSYVSFEDTEDLGVFYLYAKELVRLRYKNDPLRDLPEKVNKFVYYMIAGRLAVAFRSVDAKEGLLLRDDAGVVAVCFGATQQEVRVTSDFSNTSIFLSLFDNDSYGKFRPVSTFFFNRYTLYAVLSIPDTWKSHSDHHIRNKIKEHYTERHERNAEKPFSLFLGFPRFVMDFFRDLVIECSMKPSRASSSCTCACPECGRKHAALGNVPPKTESSDDEETYDSCSSDMSDPDEDMTRRYDMFDMDDDIDFAFADDVIDIMMITIGKKQATTKLLITMIRSVINRIDRDEWRMLVSDVPKIKTVKTRASSFCLKRMSSAMDNLAEARQRADRVAAELLLEESKEKTKENDGVNIGGGANGTGAPPFVLPEKLPTSSDALRELLQLCEKEFSKARDASKRLKGDASKTARNAAQERVKRAHTARESTKNALKKAEKTEKERAEADQKKREEQKQAEQAKQRAEERAAREAMHALEEAERKAHLEQASKMLASMRVAAPAQTRASAPTTPAANAQTLLPATPKPPPVIMPTVKAALLPPLPAYLQPSITPPFSPIAQNSIWGPKPKPTFHAPDARVGRTENPDGRMTPLRPNIPLYPSFMFPLPLQPSPWAAVAASVAPKTSSFHPRQHAAQYNAEQDDNACIVCMEALPDTTTTCCKRMFMCASCAVRVKRCPLCDCMDFVCLPEDIV
jgi:hypothetical protein